MSRRIVLFTLGAWIACGAPIAAASMSLDRLIQQNVQSATDAVQHSSPGVAQRPAALLWIQIRAKSQEAMVNTLRADVAKTLLNGRAVKIQPLQTLAFGPKKSELRFFRKDDANDAQRLLGTLRRTIADVQLRDLSATYSRVTWIRSGHFELWLAP